MKRYIALIFVFSVLLAGCSSLNVRTDVSSFHDMGATTGVTYSIIPFNEQVGGLEFRTYAQLVNAELKKVGMIEVGAQDASVAIFIKYGIDNGREVQSSYPIIGQTGVASSSTYGSVNRYGNTSTLNATTYNTPSYGVVGSGVRTDTVFHRFLELEIVEVASLKSGVAPRKLYQGKVTSVGTTGQLSAVMPYLIESIFRDFPGQSGKARHYEIRMDKNK